MTNVSQMLNREKNRNGRYCKREIISSNIEPAVN